MTWQAPGVDVYSPKPTGKGRLEYDQGFSGTSASAPMVTGVAAIMKAINPNLSPFTLKQALERTADPIETGELDKPLGGSCFRFPDIVNKTPDMTVCRLNALHAVKTTIPSYDFGIDFVSIDGNINPVPSCTFNNFLNKTVSFFDGFNDGKITEDCTSNFFTFGPASTFSETNNFINLESKLAATTPGGGKAHLLQLNQFLKENQGDFEILVKFKPEVTAAFDVALEGGIYGIFITEPSRPISLPSLSIQVQNFGGRTIIQAGRNAEPNRTFRFPNVSMSNVPSIILKINFNSQNNTLTPSFSLDNGLTFFNFKNPDNSIFSPEVFDFDDKAVFQVFAQLFSTNPHLPEEIDLENPPTIEGFFTVLPMEE